jgi:hypothetical protein
MPISIIRPIGRCQKPEDSLAHGPGREAMEGVLDKWMTKTFGAQPGKATKAS